MFPSFQNLRNLSVGAHEPHLQRVAHATWRSKWLHLPQGAEGFQLINFQLINFQLSNCLDDALLVPSARNAGGNGGWASLISGSWTPAYWSGTRRCRGLGAIGRVMRIRRM